jgi:hypothetical protein
MNWKGGFWGGYAMVSGVGLGVAVGPDWKAAATTRTEKATVAFEARPT